LSSLLRASKVWYWSTRWKVVLRGGWNQRASWVEYGHSQPSRPPIWSWRTLIDVDETRLVAAAVADIVRRYGEIPQQLALHTQAEQPEISHAPVTVDSRVRVHEPSGIHLVPNIG
jgi:hypothetical protein